MAEPPSPVYAKTSSQSISVDETDKSGMNFLAQQLSDPSCTQMYVILLK